MKVKKITLELNEVDQEMMRRLLVNYTHRLRDSIEKDERETFIKSHPMEQRKMLMEMVSGDGWGEFEAKKEMLSLGELWKTFYNEFLMSQMLEIIEEE